MCVLKYQVFAKRRNTSPDIGYNPHEDNSLFYVQDGTHIYRLYSESV